MKPAHSATFFQRMAGFITIITMRRPTLLHEQRIQACVDTTEAHEGKRKQTCRDEDDGHTTHATGHFRQIQLLAQTCKHHQGKSEANGRGEGVDDALQEVVILLDDEDGDTQHGTVRGDERQEDAQGLIECRRYFLQDDLHHLHQRSDDEDEGQRLQVLQAQRIEHKVLYEPRHDSGERHHKGHGGSHAQRGVYLLRHAQERADAEELRQDDIVDEYRGDEYKYVFHNSMC